MQSLHTWPGVTTLNADGPQAIARTDASDLAHFGAPLGSFQLPSTQSVSASARKVAQDTADQFLIKFGPRNEMTRVRNTLQASLEELRASHKWCHDPGTPCASLKDAQSLIEVGLKLASASNVSFADKLEVDAMPGSYLKDYLVRLHVFLDDLSRDKRSCIGETSCSTLLSRVAEDLQTAASTLDAYELRRSRVLLSGTMG